MQIGRAKLVSRPPLNLAPQAVAEQLVAVAQAQHRLAHRQNLGVVRRGLRVIDAGRAARQNQPVGVL